MAASLCISRHLISRPSPNTALLRPVNPRATAVRCSLVRRPDYVPGYIPDPKYVRVLDTTLRDGEQSPGAAMTAPQKLDIARQLARLGVDVIVLFEREFLYRILGEVISAGATTLNIADTVGCSLPNEFGKLIVDIKANTPGIENVIIATHCHNDLGLASANALQGAEAGARQVEVTVNGIGERAGNTSLEEVVMALKCRGEQLLDGLYTGINTQQLVMASNMVEEYSGLRLQPHKAIVGANAFIHQSGIHQDGMLKNKSTYEFMSPEDIGLIRSNESGIVLGKLSGRRALKAKLLELGYDIDGNELNGVFARFKTIASVKKVITHDDLIALV